MGSRGWSSELERGDYLSLFFIAVYIYFIISNINSIKLICFLFFYVRTFMALSMLFPKLCLYYCQQNWPHKQKVRTQLAALYFCIEVLNRCIATTHFFFVKASQLAAACRVASQSWLTEPNPSRDFFSHRLHRVSTNPAICELQHPKWEGQQMVGKILLFGFLCTIYKAGKVSKVPLLSIYRMTLKYHSLTYGPQLVVVAI